MSNPSTNITPETSRLRKELVDACDELGASRLCRGWAGVKSDFFSSLLGWEERAPTEDA